VTANNKQMANTLVHAVPPQAPKAHPKKTTIRAK